MKNCNCFPSKKINNKCEKCYKFICQSCDRCQVCPLFGGAYLCRDCVKENECSCITGKYKSGHSYIPIFSTVSLRPKEKKKF